MINLRQLEEFFSETRETYASGRSTWNIDEVCRWSYFFIDQDRNILMPLDYHLESQGYEFIGTLDPEDGDENPIYFLRLDKIERHTPQSLHELKSKLYEVSDKLGIAGYDGMDVGAVDEP